MDPIIGRMQQNNPFHISAEAFLYKQQRLYTVGCVRNCWCRSNVLGLGALKLM